MKKIIFILFILFSSGASVQEGNENRGTITVQKKGRLHSVIYDDVNFRLICKDVYGNIIDTAIVSYNLNFTVKGIAYGEKAAGPALSRQTQQRLSRLDGVVILMFSEIKAKEKDGSIIAFPNFKAKTGNLRETYDY